MPTLTPATEQEVIRTEEPTDVAEGMPIPVEEPKVEQPKKKKNTKKEPNWKNECKKKDKEIEELAAHIEMLEHKNEALFVENKRLKINKENIANKYRAAFSNLATAMNSAMNSFDLATRD